MAWGPDGVKLIDSKDLSDDDAAMVAEVSETVTKDGGSLKVKSHDKVRALELLGKHLGIFVDKIEMKDMTPTPVVEELITTREDASTNPTHPPAG